MMPQRGSWNSSPPLISPPLLIILLPILALTLLFLTVPPLLSAATNVLRPASVKTSWDSLNILIVVFAILFGVFARRNDDEQSPPQNTNDVVQHRNDAYIRVSSEGSGTSGYESHQWYGFPEEAKVYDDNTMNPLQSPVTSVSRLRRRSSSYPDLRQWTTDDDSYKFRFYDDFEIDKQFRSPAREHFAAVEHRKRWPEDRKLEEVSVKEIPVDTYETRPSPPVKSPTPVPPPPPPPPLPPQDLARRHPRQMHRKVENVREITEIDDRELIEVQFPQPDPPTPPLLRPSAKTRSEHRSGKSSERKKSNVKREIAMVWASVLSNQRKRKKKQRTKNDHDHDHHYDNVEVNELTNNTIAPPTPPPPPPPPPPPSVFHSIFRKGLSKNKKIHSVSTPTPPAPPSPPSLTSSRRWSKRKNQIPPPPPAPAPPRRGTFGKPPLPNKTSNIINETINVNAVGNQSLLIPPPPPPPPFKISAMKFSVRGDFVKIGSNQSSRCSSPEREHIDVEVSETTTTPTPVTVTTVNNAVTDNNCHVNGSVFCPSPDVNVKAATFIARLRGEWRLEKLNSIKEKGNGSLPLARGYSL